MDTLILIGKWSKIHGLQQTNRLSIEFPMEELEKGPKELKRFVAVQEEQ